MLICTCNFSVYGIDPFLILSRFAGSRRNPIKDTAGILLWHPIVALDARAKLKALRCLLCPVGRGVSRMPSQLEIIVVVITRPRRNGRL